MAIAVKMKIKDSMLVNFVFPHNIPALKIKDLLLLVYAKVRMELLGVSEQNASQDHAQAHLLSITAYILD